MLPAALLFVGAGVLGLVGCAYLTRTFMLAFSGRLTGRSQRSALARPRGSRTRRPSALA